MSGFTKYVAGSVLIVVRNQIVEINLIPGTKGAGYEVCNQIFENAGFGLNLGNMHIY